MARSDADEDAMMLKAEMIALVVMSLSRQLFSSMKENIDDLNKLPHESENEIIFIISYVLLFRAQSFAWQKNANDQYSSTKFEKLLFIEYEKIVGVNPTSHVTNLAKYCSDSTKAADVQYIGSTICNKLGKKDAILMFKISTSYSSFVAHLFFTTLNIFWDLDPTKYEQAIQAFKLPEKESGSF